MKSLMMVLALASAAPLSARDIGVAANENWRHAGTGLILTPQMAGMARTVLTDATESERDVTAKFEAADKSVRAAIYVFRPPVADVGMWFDSSQTALRSGDLFRDAVPATADPIGFTAGGAHVASSLRRVYTKPGGEYRSTALAVVPVGRWLVSIRMSAKMLTADELDARLRQMVAAVRWPVGATARAAAPVKACTTPLVFTTAALVKPGSAVVKTGRGIAGLRSTWCRDGEARTDYGVYRSDRDPRGYVLALNSTGGVVSVYPSAISKSATYGVSLEDVDGGVSTLPAFTSLPTPEQVWDLVESRKPSGTRGRRTASGSPEGVSV